MSSSVGRKKKAFPLSTKMLQSNGLKLIIEFCRKKQSCCITPHCYDKVGSVFSFSCSFVRFFVFPFFGWKVDPLKTHRKSLPSKAKLLPTPCLRSKKVSEKPFSCSVLLLFVCPFFGWKVDPPKTHRRFLPSKAKL